MNVFTTSRHLRNYLKSNLNSNGLIQKSITIDEFENRSIVIDNLKIIDSDIRTIFMYQASSFYDFSKLKFNKDFINFFFESDFIFKFFEEIYLENISLDDLVQKKLYTDYSDEIEILKILLTNYISLLKQNSYYDRILIPNNYKLNLEYLKNFEFINIHIESYLSYFELQLLNNISKIIQLNIYLNTNKFNKKMIKKFEQFNIFLAENNNYIIDFSNKKIISNIENKNQTNFEVKAFSQRLNQIAFIKAKLYEFIEIDKFLPENIAIILPDESFAKYLDIFDNEINLNFAMGKSITQNRLFVYLNTLFEYIKEKNVLTFNRLKRLSIDDELQENILKSKNSLDNLVFYDLINKILEYFKDDEIFEFIYKELYRLKQYDIFLDKLTFKQKFQILLSNIQNKHLDDINGGKITVVGLLESRGITFDGVIIVDFNEDTVPKYNQKDIFLSTFLRIDLGLPTKDDRLNLQKYLYKRVFDNSKKVSISYVQNDSYIPSRFLTELDLKKSAQTFDEYYDYLTLNFIKRDVFNKEIILNIDFKDIKISASSLNTFLSCKRKYYLKHIQKIKEHEISLLPSYKNIGTILHETLKELYLNNTFFENGLDMQKKFKNHLFKHISHDHFTNYEINVWSKKIEFFCNHEYSRLSSGVMPIAFEEPINFIYKNLQIVGSIDRIDKFNDEYFVIDYKSSTNISVDSERNFEKSVDFQLELYYLYTLRVKNYLKTRAFFYDLNNGELLEEKMLKEKLEILENIFDMLLKSSSFNFSKCEDTKVCLYCPYKIMCGRY
ncbi:MAG: PD-(D/E)XK nuclease family protein [Campylobacterales bacterium]|nr:PD-(D/E)XK nuclease family protein [Campylobacterales bacterium]